MQINIIGGGAAGFFTAINVKELIPKAEVTILERGHGVLRKVAVSGGGRCNVTNTFEGIGDLSEVYPRGHRLMRKLLQEFSPEDIFKWFEDRKVRLTAQSDHCVFPASQNSQTIIDCFESEARRLGVKIKTDVKEIDLDAMLKDGSIAVVCTGGITSHSMSSWLGVPEEDIVPPVPSLFSLSINDPALRKLMGTVVAETTVSLAGTKHKAKGDLLITHWGVSGPATLRLSSSAARTLSECKYQGTLIVNWLGASEEAAASELKEIISASPQKALLNARPAKLTGRLWEHIIAHGLGDAKEKRWCELGKKEVNKLIQELTAAPYPISGRAPFKDEFVTAGGISLTSVNSKTMESKRRSGLYFAGEVMDIDGVTGGFNFTAAWCTAMAAARSIAKNQE